MLRGRENAPIKPSKALLTVKSFPDIFDIETKDSLWLQRLLDEHVCALHNGLLVTLGKLQFVVHVR